jgi:hypothetical protein
MGALIEAFLRAIMGITSVSIRTAHRAGRSYDGRAVSWRTVLAASTAGAAYVPMMVGSFFAVGEAIDLLESDFMWFLGILLIGPALLLVAVMIAGVCAGITVGAWMLIERPGARLFAAAYAVFVGMSGTYATAMSGPVGDVVGKSTIGLAGLLFLMTLIPDARPSNASPPSSSPVVEDKAALNIPSPGPTERWVL